VRGASGNGRPYRVLPLERTLTVKRPRIAALGRYPVPRVLGRWPRAKDPTDMITLGKGNTMTAHTETQSIEIDAEPDATFGILADAKNIPLWAPAFADTIVGDEQHGWKATKNGKAFDLRVVASRSVRTVDFLREVVPGREGGAYARVLPGPSGGSVAIMTLPVPPDADAAIIAATLAEELVALARLAKRSIDENEAKVD